MDLEDGRDATVQPPSPPLPLPPPPPHSFKEPDLAYAKSILGSVLHVHEFEPTSLEQGLFRFFSERDDEHSDTADDRVINLKSVLGDLVEPKDQFLPEQIYV